MAKKKTGAPKTKAPGPERVKKGRTQKAPARAIPKDRPPGVKVKAGGQVARPPAGLRDVG